MSLFSPPPSASDPFRLQSDGRRSRSVDQGNRDMPHEVLFEDRFTAMQDRRVFLGTGIAIVRLRTAFALAAVIFLALLVRAAWMQFVEGTAYAARAEDNRVRHDVVPARRGIIRDRNGMVLVENVPSFQVNMRESDLPRDGDGRAQTIATVALAVGTTSDDLERALAATGTVPDEWVAVARDVPYERAVALQVKLPDLGGVALSVGTKRRYAESEKILSLSHVLGYVGPLSPTEYANRKEMGYRRTDDIGKTGVERSQEAALRGMAGERRIEVDAFGRPRAVVGDVAAIDGTDLTLTLDLTLQRASEAALKKGLERAKVQRGSVVLMDARDGSIRALVSWPAYDDNIFAGNVSTTAYRALLADEQHPLFPRAWAGQFPSGSTIKPLIATAALAENVITPNTTVLSVGGIGVGPWFFPDWKPGGHGRVNVRSAIAWSVNTFFYTVGGGYGDFIGLGVDRLTKWMRDFGLGANTGVDLPGEAPGHVPSQEWKQETKGDRWYIGDTYNLSIGQGDLLVTPLQMARITAAIANGGSLVVPHVVMSSSTPDIIKLNADAATLATIRQGMRETVTYGSGRALNALPVPSAGKTGTAQWNSEKPYHAWYIGYAPADNPEVVVTVLLEEGGEGSSVAVPVAGDMLRAWWDQRNGKDSSASTSTVTR